MFNLILTLPNISQLFSNFNWSAGSLDLFILLFFVLVVLAHVFALKREKIFALLLGIYVSYLLVLFFPYQTWLKNLNLEALSWTKLGMFAFGILLLATIFSKARLFAAGYPGFLSRIFQAIIFGILNAGLILVLAATLLPWQFINQFSLFSQKVFTGELLLFIWLALPILVLLIFVKIKRRGPGRPSVEY